MDKRLQLPSGEMPLYVSRERGAFEYLLETIFRRKTAVLAFLVLSTLTAGVLTLAAGKVYQSEAKVMIRVGRESVGADPSILGPTLSVYQVRESEVNSEISIMRSRAIAEGVVAALGADKFVSTEPGPLDGVRSTIKRFLGKREEVPARELAVEKIKKGLKIEVEPKSYIINLQYEDNSPDLAQQTLGAILTAYNERHVEAYRSQVSPEFFERQAEDMRNALHSKEEELERFKEKHGIASLDSQRTILLNQINEMQAEIDRSQARASQSQARIAAFEKTLDGRKADLSADGLQRTLGELRAREAQLAFRYRDDNELMVRLRAQIRQTEDALNRARAANSSLVVDSEQNLQSVKLSLANERAQFQAAQAAVQTISKEMESRRRKLDELVGNELTVVRLKREVDALQQDYLKYRDNLLRANISESLDKEKTTNATVIQAATLSRIPVKPNPLLNMLMGVMAGLLGGIMLALVMEWFDDRLKMDRDVEDRLGLPVLASIQERGVDRA